MIYFFEDYKTLLYDRNIKEIHTETSTFQLLAQSPNMMLPFMHPFFFVNIPRSVMF